MNREAQKKIVDAKYCATVSKSHKKSNLLVCSITELGNATANRKPAGTARTRIPASNLSEARAPISRRRKMAVTSAAACISFVFVMLLNARTLGDLHSTDGAADHHVHDTTKPKHDVDVLLEVDNLSTVNEGQKSTKEVPVENEEDPVEVPRVQKPNLEKSTQDHDDAGEASEEDAELKPESLKKLRELETHSEKESWSDDGRVHCVEESSDVIKCHSHDALSEDAPYHLKPDDYRRVDDRISDAVKKAGGDLNIKKKLSENVDESVQRTNLHKRNGRPEDGILLPPVTSPLNSTSADQRQLVELDHSEGVLKIIDTLTGKKRNITELTGQEDVDTDSLMTVKSKRLVKVPKFETLQKLLEYQKKKNFSEIEIDFERTEKHELWPKDNFCKGLMNRFGRSTPRSLVVSYPRSGSSWLRYLLEAATGVFTGSTSNSSLLYSLGFYGEREAFEQDSTLTITTHSVDPLPGERWNSTETDDAIPTVLLMRNPADALISQWHVLNSTGVNWYKSSSPPSSFATKEFHSFVSSELRRWEQTYASRLLWSSNVYVLHYEELQQHPLQQLLKVLVFLQLPPPTGKRLFCLRNNINGPLKAGRSKINPYSIEEEDALWAAVTRVSGALRLRGLALPPHYRPIDRYPPERAQRGVRRHSGRRKHANKGDRDEL
ncbi:Sulfotransferase domain [Trinorchestia longiramus]|nr:Sulfotransferase domain [Trinorchestia longiramus]